MDFGSQQRKEKDVWLAMKYGCCASKEDADDGEALRGNGERQMQIVYDQPQTVPHPSAEPTYYARPSTSHSLSRHVSQWVNTSRDFATRASSRASFSTLTRPRRSHSIYRVRPIISRPTNFQHFDNGIGLDGIQSMVNGAPTTIRRNRSLRRLELSIYLPDGCGRLSPLPDFEDEEAWDVTKTDLERPAQALVRIRDSRTSSLSSDPSTSEYLVQRKRLTSTAVSLSRRSSVQSQKSNNTSFTHERHLSGTTAATMQTPTLSTWVEEPHASSDSFFEKPFIRRSNTSGTLSPARVLSRLPSPSRSRANTAPTRPGSLRRVKTDVDEAIRELNTIVEERRASAYRSQIESPALFDRPPPSPSHHVPYIAPSMRMRVRSETLSDIGSAFSAPLSHTKALPTPPTTSFTPPPRRGTRLTLSPPSRTNSMALCSNPITPPAPITPTSPSSTKKITRLTTWLKRSISTATTPTTPAETKPFEREPFYKCDQSRPSTAGSRTICHARQDSGESATVTLFGSSPAISERSVTPTSTSAGESQSPPMRKVKRVPAPLNLAKEKDMMLIVEKALGTGKSVRGMGDAKPPNSPNVNLLRGMELVGRDVGEKGGFRMGVPSPGAVGVAF